MMPTTYPTVEDPDKESAKIKEKKKKHKEKTQPVSPGKNVNVHWAESKKQCFSIPSTIVLWGTTDQLAGGREILKWQIF